MASVGSVAATILEKSRLGNTGTLCCSTCFKCFSLQQRLLMLRVCVATAARAKRCSAEWPRFWARLSRPSLQWRMGGHHGEQMALTWGMASKTSWGTRQVTSEWGHLIPGRSLLQPQLDGAIV